MHPRATESRIPTRRTQHIGIFNDRHADQLDRIEGMLQNVLRYSAYLPLLLKVELQELKSMSELSDAITDLGTKVQADTDVDNAALTLMNGLTAAIKLLQSQVAAAADVPAALTAVKAFATTLDANKVRLAQGISDNTPVDNGTPTVAPVTPPA